MYCSVDDDDDADASADDAAAAEDDEEDGSWSVARTMIEVVICMKSYNIS